MSSSWSPARKALTPLQSLIQRRWRPQWVCTQCQHSRQRRCAVTSLSSTLGDQQKPYYVTTPIFYVNAAPHVGHMYTMLLADVIKRWQVLKGRKAILCTGTDEHGMKIQQAAAKAEMPPKEFCDASAETFKDLAAQIGISNNIFMRTTDQRHKDAVEYAWQMLENKGMIYESKHEGWYSVSDEAFYTKVELIVDPPTGRKIMVSKETGKEVEWTSERNYHFRLSAFRDRLLDFYRDNPDFVVPRTRMAEVVDQVSTSLADLSISRPTERLTWGVRVPTDASQTIYVWLDALLNYATAAGYPFAPGSEHAGGWPADVHVIGKDIVRFHCIYWPAFLMALGLPLPKQVLTHAHWTLGKQKMAKSTGNVVNPFYALDRFSLDIMRWYLIHEGGINDDADYDNMFIVRKYEKHLRGGLGNLTSRVTRAKGWNIHRAVKRYSAPDTDTGEALIGDAQEDDKNFHRFLRKLPAEADGHMNRLYPNLALQALSSAIGEVNAYFSKNSPWALVTKLQTIATDTTGQLLHEAAKVGETPEQLEAQIDRIIYLTAESLRLVGIMQQPFIPDAAKRLLDMLGVSLERRTWEWCHVGKDDDYGVPLVDLGRGHQGVLFPALTVTD